MRGTPRLSGTNPRTSLLSRITPPFLDVHRTVNFTVRPTIIRIPPQRSVKMLGRLIPSPSAPQEPLLTVRGILSRMSLANSHGTNWDPTPDLPTLPVRRPWPRIQGRTTTPRRLGCRRHPRRRWVYPHTTVRWGSKDAKRYYTPELIPRGIYGDPYPESQPTRLSIFGRGEVPQPFNDMLDRRSHRDKNAVKGC